ncbi:putative transcriptional regulator of viral defense system [Psychromicrobium silvestre]|uniref:Putative transcriptional regulator of viral defense system n=1 Tax=Psychromicrobium silvestre TaxID=1645614 RepID=A0A7Y9LRN9_9MICC|nr:hypothetical protein [Psychromicrobium silvestre]NYE94359.1 putative transcriptional regulator of viral defense system [Psychromicrobium silvestre]
MDRLKLQQRLGARWPEGIVQTRLSLELAGINHLLLQDCLAAGIVLKIRKGGYLLRERWEGSEPWHRAQWQLEAHHLVSGGVHLYTHQSAARLHGLRTWGLGERIHLNIPYRWSRGSFGDDVTVHRYSIPGRQECLVQNELGQEFRVTSLERTATDCARLLGFEQAVVLGDHALQKGADLTYMRRLLAATPGSRGVRRARLVLGAIDGRSESVGESRLRLIVSDLAPTSQLELATTAGLFRADLGWSEARLLLEFDGRSKYFDYGASSEVVFQERRREKALVAEGWRIIRVEWADLERPAALRRRVISALKRSVP